MQGELSRIVCADDDADILAIIRLCLEMIPGLDLACCSNGLQAVEAARTLPPDLIILDVMMPTMDGPEAIRRLKADEALAAIPVILMTARIQTAEISEYLRLGAAAVVAKPFDPMALAPIVTDVFERSRCPSAASGGGLPVSPA